MRSACQSGAPGKVKENSHGRPAAPVAPVSIGSFCPALTMLQAWERKTGAEFRQWGLKRAA
jgi:hypothetical protein